MLTDDGPLTGPRKRGYLAFKRGAGRLDCPHKVGESGRLDWLIGWRRANDEESDIESVLPVPLLRADHTPETEDAPVDVEIKTPFNSIDPPRMETIGPPPEVTQRIPRKRGRPRAETRPLVKLTRATRKAAPKKKADGAQEKLKREILAGLKAAGLR